MDKITQRVKELEDLIQQRKGTKMLTSGEIGCLRNKLKGFKEGVAMERERVKEINDKSEKEVEK